jgi:hypothetical protein
MSNSKEHLYLVAVDPADARRVDAYATIARKFPDMVGFGRYRSLWFVKSFMNVSEIKLQFYVPEYRNDSVLVVAITPHATGGIDIRDFERWFERYLQPQSPDMAGTLATLRQLEEKLLAAEKRASLPPSATMHYKTVFHAGHADGGANARALESPGPGWTLFSVQPYVHGFFSVWQKEST